MLDLESYLTAIHASARALADAADEAGPDAVVPTCPGWTVADLVRHQGMVHRWAAGQLRDAPQADGDALESQALASFPADQAAGPGWLRDGADALRASLRNSADDVPALVFLQDAPPPRLFWARRQTHETTVHGVDALGAALGRTPRSAETAIAPELALDGLDELLTGFLPRRRSRLRQATPMTVAVRPDDAGRGWLLTVSPDPPRADRIAPGQVFPEADVTLTGTAAALYLGLWNRGDEVFESGGHVLDLWRTAAQVSW